MARSGAVSKISLDRTRPSRLLQDRYLRKKTFQRLALFGLQLLRVAPVLTHQRAETPLFRLRQLGLLLPSAFFSQVIHHVVELLGQVLGVLAWWHPAACHANDLGAGRFQYPGKSRLTELLAPMDRPEQFSQGFADALAVGLLFLVRERGEEFHVAKELADRREGRMAYAFHECYRRGQPRAKQAGLRD